jgi:hypothetical protein
MDDRPTMSQVSSTNESSRWIWIVVGVVLVILIIGVIIFGIFFFLRKEPATTVAGCYNENGPTENQTSSLRMTNHCCQPIWVEARAGPCSAPLPGQNKTVFKVNPGSFIDFNIPPNGLAATRFWAKWGCNESGTNCQMGDQDPTWVTPGTCPEPYGCAFFDCSSGACCPTGGSCPANGCTPPIDTLFEATWGCSVDQTDCNINSSSCTGGCFYRGCPTGGCNFLDNITSFDMSQVDGWTFPYRLYVKGDKEDLAQCNGGTGAFNIDAIGLSLSKCPTTENMSDNGQFETVTDPDTGQDFSTDPVDLRFTKQNQIVGCFHPARNL